nr:unnamed protein product [Digitaria exilis]
MVAKELGREVISMDSKVKTDGEALIAAGDEEDDVVLPGFRFHPTDEELASTAGGEKEWYFFCLRGRKYRNSIRPNRVTGSGFWKATGIDRPIYSPTNSGGDSIGLKKSLVYYRGSAGKGTKTDWMMHEFRLPPATPAATATNASPSMQEAEVWTICRIFKRNLIYKRQQVWRPPVATANGLPPAESSSNTGSFESDAGDEYMNCLSAAAPSAPRQHHFSNQINMLNASGGGFFRDNLHSQQFQGQWFNSLPAAPAIEQKPQLNSPAMTIAFHQNDQNLAATDCYKEGYWEEIARFMEVNDPAVFSDCRYA